MQIDFQLFNNWSQLNLNLQKSSFSHIQHESLLCYKTSTHALKELSLELANQFPMKKEVFFIKEMHPYIEAPVTELAKRGYKLKPISFDEAKNPEYWKEHIGRESLVFFCPIDDPVLGLIHPFTEIREALAEQKIIQIYVSHSWHKTVENVELGKFENLICFHNKGLSVALLGGKLRATGLVTKLLDWDQTLEVGETSSKLDKERVQKIESSPVGGCLFPLKDQESRLFDRIVMTWEDIDGSAVLELFQEKLGADLSLQVFSSSLSFWGGLRTFSWLSHLGLSENQVRGLLVFDPQLLDSKNLELLEETCKELRQLQSGEE